MVPAQPHAESTPLRIDQVAAAFGLRPDAVEPCGWYKGKLALGLEQRLPERPGTKYIGANIPAGLQILPRAERKAGK